MCPGCVIEVGLDGWLADRGNYWVMHFYRDESSAASKPRVFVDYGRGMPNGKAALLKSRKKVTLEDADKQWNRLLQIGWRQVAPVWDGNLKPQIDVTTAPKDQSKEC